MDGSPSRAVGGDGAARPGWAALFERLRADVILGRRHPRERLIEDDVIAETGATRHAVRRAFDALERAGLAERQPNRGVRVRHYARAEVEGLYEIRDALERRAAAHFAAPAPAALVAELGRLAEAHARLSAQGEAAAIFAANNAFHRRLYGACGNDHLARAIDHYTVATHPVRTWAFPIAARREQAVREHVEMVEAVAAGDAGRLADTIGRHIAGPKDLYLASLAQAGP